MLFLHEEILQAFHIDTKKDSPEIHPQKLCNKCYLSMKRVTAAAQKKTPYKCSVESGLSIPWRALTLARVTAPKAPVSDLSVRTRKRRVQELQKTLHNTFVFSCFEADDTVTNLHVALDRFRSEVDHISTMKWRTYTLKLYLTGDLEFLSIIVDLKETPGAVPSSCSQWKLRSSQNCPLETARVLWLVSHLANPAVGERDGKIKTPC
ncbi:hypothetical protein EMCRGX_G010454 [Ephydatia muelleri]